MHEGEIYLITKALQYQTECQNCHRIVDLTKVSCPCGKKFKTTHLTLGKRIFLIIRSLGNLSICVPLTKVNGTKWFNAVDSISDFMIPKSELTGLSYFSIAKLIELQPIDNRLLSKKIGKLKDSDFKKLLKKIEIFLKI